MLQKGIKCDKIERKKAGERNGKNNSKMPKL